MSSQRNIADFYNEIQNKQGGLRYQHQFIVRLNFKQNFFTDRGVYSGVDKVIFNQLGITEENTLNQLTNPNPEQPQNDLTLFAQSTSLPRSQITPTVVTYFAQTFHFPGIMNYETSWTVNVLLDQKLTIYRQLKAWQEMISSISRNSGGNKTIPEAQGVIELLDGYGRKAQRRFSIEGIFPTNLQTIDMQYEENGAIKNMNVQFAMQFFRQIPATQGDTYTQDIFKEF